MRHRDSTPDTARPSGSARTSLAALLLALPLVLFFAVPAQAQEQARKLVALLDYLGSDYKHAVADGKILSNDEYGEMQEFAKRGLELFAQLKEVDKGDKAGVEGAVKSLADHVAKKADPKTVAEVAKGAKDKLIAAYNIVPYPKRLPSLADGKQLYNENCAQCHGATGKGDGSGRESMNPKTPLPANFTDPERIGALSPFKAFNTASFGVEGTAMASFAALSEEQRWQVAFYIFSLRFSQEAAKSGTQLAKSKNLPADLQTVAVLATTPMKSYWKNSRASRPVKLTPWLCWRICAAVCSKTNKPIPWSVARTLLREAVELYRQGDKDKAYQKSVEAYLDGYEFAEPTLIAKDANFGRGLESQFTQLRNAIKLGEPVELIQKRHLEIEVKLDQAAHLLANDDKFTGYYAFANSALIILREGLEAALILAAILAMLRVMGATEAVKYIHLGWILALVAGALTWLATETVLTLSGRNRESMEGFISVFAALALFYVGYWLHTRSEARKWRAFIEDKVKAGISGQRVFGLMGISFFAVYREAFELVLFYQALWLQNESAHSAVLWGFAAGLGALILATIAILKLGLRIPLKYFFTATGTLLYIVAFIFAGNGIKELQASLWVPTTPLNAPPPVPVLGIYPTVETLSAQAIMLVAFIATSFWMSKQRRVASEPVQEKAG